MKLLILISMFRCKQRTFEHGFMFELAFERIYSTNVQTYSGMIKQIFLNVWMIKKDMFEHIY